MAVGYNPRAITDGLVLALDAQNSKSWKSGTTWTDKVGGNNGTLVGGTYHNDGPFVGAGYVDFNSSGDYLSIADSADLELDTNTTIELFIKFNTIPTVATYIFGKINGYWLAYDSTAVGGVADRFTFAIYNGSSWSGATNASGGFLPVVNTWYHIAIVKEGTSTKLYVDGTLYGSGTFSGTPADNSNAVQIPYSSTNLDADISNVRFIRGTALYTSNFTPPTKSLTAVTNTTLLTCQGNTIADASSSAHSISVTGNAAANLGFPASAFEFDGSNDYVSISSSNDFAFGTGDFTIEFWAYFQGSGSYENIFDFRPAGTNGNYPLLARDSVDGDLYYYVNSSRLIDNVSVSNDRWYHIVICREGTTTRLYLNGEIEGSATDSTNYITSNVLMGSYSGGGNYFNGKISAVKIYKGKGLTAAEVTQNYNATKGRYA